MAHLRMKRYVPKSLISEEMGLDTTIDHILSDMAYCSMAPRRGRT